MMSIFRGELGVAGCHMGQDILGACIGCYITSLAAV